jgi:ribosome biogenesis GTPase / thiamine phosphate phosphatase
LNRGLVIKSTGSWYYVKDDKDRVIPCKIKGTYRIRGIRATNPVAVGDNVIYNLADDGTGMITEIGERKNYIIRRATNLSREYQLIASNVDQAILMISLKQPTTHLAFVDRFLVSAEAFRIPVILVINKVDIYGDKEQREMDRFIHIYEEIGYQTLPLSLKSKYNLDELKELLSNSVTVIAGNSGVGKSTLLNYLDPLLDLRTGRFPAIIKQDSTQQPMPKWFFLVQAQK